MRMFSACLPASAVLLTVVVECSGTNAHRAFARSDLTTCSGIYHQWELEKVEEANLDRI